MFFENSPLFFPFGDGIIVLIRQCAEGSRERQRNKVRRVPKERKKGNFRRAKAMVIRMISFEPVIGNIRLLKVPFGDSFTGVVLIDGDTKILIDSGALESDVDNILIPALEKEGYTLADIMYLLNTHSHGDHIGGFARIRELAPGIQVVAARSDWKNVEDPAALAIRTRGKYPPYSPTPQSYLKGVKVDRIMDDGEVLADSLMLVETPGHDPGCVCWYDLKTKTIITGDSLQGNGTSSQGIGFYKDLNLYRYSLHKLAEMDIENILCGHDYDQIGVFIRGKKAVGEALKKCLSLTLFYQKYVDRMLRSGVTDPGQIAERLIREHGCGMPGYLFMAVYTVCEHIALSETNFNDI